MLRPLGNNSALLGQVVVAFQRRFVKMSPCLQHLRCSLEKDISTLIKQENVNVFGATEWRKRINNMARLANNQP